MLTQPELPGEPGIRVWKGTASDLLKALDNLAGPAATRSKGWPKLPNALSQKLCGEVAPALEKRGVVVERGARRHGGSRSLAVTHRQKNANPEENTESGASPSSPGGDVPEQELNMQSQTAENEKTIGDDGGGAGGDADPAASPVSPECGDATPPASPPSSPGPSPRENPGKRPVSKGKIAPGGDGDDVSLSSGEKEISGSVSPSVLPGAGAADRGSPTQPQTEEPPEPPGAPPGSPRVRRTF
jgi:hypothetical protein